MSDSRYITLIKILDGIRKSAPDTAEFARFKSKKLDDIQYTRGQAYIHLFLQVKFGLESFEERQNLITDGEQDGGLDAYFISEQKKIVFLIQAKFKNSSTGFVGESIPSSDLVKLELDRILQGHHTDSNGVTYNTAIIKFQDELNRATRKSAYTQIVIFLANLNNYNDTQIRKLTGNLDYDICDFEKTYLELVKPVCSGTYYDPDQVVIELDISDKSTPQLGQVVKTSYGNCDVMAVFVPTSELGRVMSRHKNAILRFNPRNYLGLSKNPVNKEIRKSIISKTENDFALLNNGITILADEQTFSVHTGKENVGRLTLINPQIINGGQTAYTLSEIYENELKTTPTVFKGKEVLVRVVVLKQQPQNEVGESNKHKFMQAISGSTNQQTQVKEADRHSSDPLLVGIQRLIFSKYGQFVELKSGEFYDGLAKGYINKTLVVDRIRLLRSYIAFSGRPTAARNRSESEIYEDGFFNVVFSAADLPGQDSLASEMMFAYRLHSILVNTDRKLRATQYEESGYGLKYGKYAMVYASSLAMHPEFKQKLPMRLIEEIDKYVNEIAKHILRKWKKFEEEIQKYESNRIYFNPQKGLADFDLYYRSSTLKKDIDGFAWSRFQESME